MVRCGQALGLPKQLLFTDNDLVHDDTYKWMVVTGNTVHIAVSYYGGEEGGWYGVLGYLRSTNNNVSVIWNGLDANDVSSVFCRQSTNSGATFSEALNLTRGVIPDGKALQAGQETLAAQGGYVYGLLMTTAAMST